MTAKKAEERIAKRAKQSAATGRHIGWWYVACEIRNAGEPLAMQVIEREPLRSEIDRICEGATKKKWAQEAAAKHGQ